MARDLAAAIVTGMTRIEDEQACADIIVGVADALDSRDDRRLGEYLRRCRWTVEAFARVFMGTRGAEQLNHESLQRHPSTARGQHDVSNILVDVHMDGASATARSDFAVLQAAGHLRLQFVLAGHYDDRFEKRDGHWRLVARAEHWDLTGDLSCYPYLRGQGEAR